MIKILILDYIEFRGKSREIIPETHAVKTSVNFSDKNV